MDKLEVAPCSCEEAAYLREALRRIGTICGEAPNTIDSWLAVAELVHAVEENSQLPAEFKPRVVKA